MQIIDAGEVLLAAGLEWEVSSSGSFNSVQLRSKARLHKARHYVEHSPRHAAQERLYGFGTLAGAVTRERRSVLSLASLVARAGPEHAAFVSALGGGVLALVGVLGGQPVPRMDLVGTEADILEELRDFVAAHGIGCVHYAEALGRPELHIPGCDLVPLAIDADDRHLARIRQVRTTLGAPTLIAGLLVTAGAAAVAVTWYQREQTLATVERAALPTDFAQSYGKAKQAAFASLPSHPADVLGVRMADWMLKQPVEQGGWMLRRVDCKAAPGANGVATCTANWAPDSAGATFAAFGTASPSQHFGLSLDQITTGADIDVAGLPALSTAAHYPLRQQFLLDDGSFFQSIKDLGVTVRLSEPTLVGAFSGPKVPGMVEQAAWAINGPVRLMHTLLTALPPNMAISDLGVAVAPTGPTFTAHGAFYVSAP